MKECRKLLEGEMSGRSEVLLYQVSQSQAHLPSGRWQSGSDSTCQIRAAAWDPVAGVHFPAPAYPKAQTGVFRDWLSLVATYPRRIPRSYSWSMADDKASRAFSVWRSSETNAYFLHKHAHTESSFVCVLPYCGMMMIIGTGSVRRSLRQGNRIRAQDRSPTGWCFLQFSCVMRKLTGRWRAN
jgi:hypothetical protein